MESGIERCPWCGTEISRARFVEIQTKIRAEEQKKLREAEAAIRKRLEDNYKRQLEVQKQAAQKLAKEEAENRIASIVAEKNLSLEKHKEAQTREATITKEAEARAQQGLKTALEAAERQRQKELKEQRQILEKNSSQLLLKKQAEFNREREAFQKKIMEMDRQLQRKTANEIGDGAEIDLFEALREAFPDDRITRIQKGQPGADVLQEVIHKAEPCGRILIDSKNRQCWQYGFVTKLREDQAVAKAEHAILSTTTFPSGKKELCIESDVIVVSPARAVHIVSLLRKAMVAMHVRGLSMKERTGKMSRLYAFITSEVYSRRFGEIAKLNGDLQQLEAEEQQAHARVWRKRGSFLKRQEHVLQELDTEIAGIVEAHDEGALPAA